MQNQLEFLNLGFFNIDLPANWDAHFFPSVESKLRLIKDEATVIIEYFLFPGTDSQANLDFFYQENVTELQRTAVGLIYEEDDEEIEYELVVENKGSFIRYFFHATGGFIFRLILVGSWEPRDEDDLRNVLKGLTINNAPPQEIGEITPGSFYFDHESWFRVGSMYSKRGGL